MKSAKLCGVLLVLGLLSSACGPKPGKTETDAKTGITLAYIPAGTFLMGSPAGEEGRRDNEIQHQVTLTKPFWMGTTEVTNALYRFVEFKSRPNSSSRQDQVLTR